MTDWTTCRVVRDRDGDLWFRGCDSDDLWTANTNYPDVFLTADELHTAFGPLTPVLDADGLPVVTACGKHPEEPKLMTADTLALLAGAWDEGKHSEHAPACRLGDGDCTCPNPYQPEGETHE